MGRPGDLEDAVGHAVAEDRERRGVRLEQAGQPDPEGGVRAAPGPVELLPAPTGGQTDLEDAEEGADHGRGRLAPRAVERVSGLGHLEELALGVPFDTEGAHGQQDLSVPDHRPGPGLGDVAAPRDELHLDLEDLVGTRARAELPRRPAERPARGQLHGPDADGEPTASIEELPRRDQPLAYGHAPAAIADLLETEEGRHLHRPSTLVTLRACSRGEPEDQEILLAMSCARAWEAVPSMAMCVPSLPNQEGLALARLYQSTSSALG